MAERLFNGQRVGVFLDDHKPRLKRTKDGDEVHLLDLKCRIQPLTRELAATLDGVRPLLFTPSGEQRPDLSRVGFTHKPARQQFHMFASPDTTAATLMLDQAEIKNISARSEKGVDGWALTFRATIGPVTSHELEYIHAWYTQQRFVECDEAQPSLEFDDEDGDDDGDDDEDDEPTAADIPPAPADAPMFDDPRDTPTPMHAAATGDNVNRKLHTHGKPARVNGTRRKGSRRRR